jgi:signal transduction histidine kinase
MSIEREEPGASGAGDPLVHRPDRRAGGPDSSPIPHVVVDAAGVVRGGNLAFAALLGRSTVPLGKPFIVVVPVVQSDLFWQALRACCEENVSSRSSFDVVLPPGNHRRVLAISAPRNLEGETAALLALVDVGEIARAEVNARHAHESELRMRAQMEALANAHVAIGEAATEGDGMRGLLAVIAEAARAVVDAELAAVVTPAGDDSPEGACDVVHTEITPAASEGLGAFRRGNGSELHVEDLASAARSAPERVLSASIKHREHEHGTLYVGFKRDGQRFDLVDERLVRALAQRASSAIEKVRTSEREVEQRTWLQAVIDKMPDQVWILDRNGVLIANEAARHMAVDDGGGRPHFDARSAEDQRIGLDALPLNRAFQGENVVDAELVMHAPTGPVPLLANAAPVVDVRGRRIGAVCVGRDISRVRALEKLREEWAAVVAHDLRQPLNVIRMSDEVLAKSTAGSDHTATRAVERIRISARRMWTMIEELIDSSLIESHQLKVVKAPTCVAACVREAVEQLANQLHGRTVTVDVPPDDETMVLADEGRVEQVLGNLLSNACKYGVRDRPIRVTVRREPMLVRIAVENEGRHLHHEELNQLFTRFFRSRDVRDSASRGLGLGLYIVSGLVRAHGGDIEARSRDGVITFEFTLPVE